MIHVLSRAGRAPLGEFARSRLLVAFDYDGTLAPITADPARAEMRERTRALLTRLCERYPCVVITGRACEDVGVLLGDVAVRAVAGNHGAELPWFDAAGPRAEVAKWRRALEIALGGVPGVVLEDKQLTLSVHYRACSDKAAAHRAILEVVEALEGVRVIGGKDVVNLIPHGAPHKGFALDELMRDASCDAAIYIGDDETDEDVFRMRGGDERLLTVRVGAKEASAAEYYLKTQEEVDDLISALVELRNRQ